MPTFICRNPNFVKYKPKAQYCLSKTNKDAYYQNVQGGVKILLAN
jgi:hypothetical protein